jgi:hypothetical protein
VEIGMFTARNARFAACAVALVVASPAWAEPPPPPQPPPLQASETFTNFGQLDQSDTACNSNGCGATALVNGLWFLQQQYPKIFGTSLIPPTKPGDDRANMISVANKLAGADYMNTQDATEISYFIYSKDKYLNEVAKGKIKIAVQTKEPWSGPPGAAPSYVQNVSPTPMFLLKELKSNEAVEVLLAYKGGGGHYITLTGIDYQPTATGGSGTLSFVDPSHPTLPGQVPSRLTISQSAKDGVISGVYKPFGTDESHEFEITFAAGQSPTPEPATWALMLAGFGAVGVTLRRRARISSPA